MKKSFPTIMAVMLLSHFVCSMVVAQERTQFNIYRKIELKEDSNPKQIGIEVNTKECRFNLRIRSSIRAGAVTLEIYDPKGKKHGNFAIGCQTDPDYTLNQQAPGESNSTEHVNGMTSKLIENPLIGEWQIKILPQKAVGEVKIEFSQDIIENKLNN